MTTVQLIPAKHEHLELLHNLMQLYLYDFSVHFCHENVGHVDEHGLFDPGFDLARYMDRAGYWAYVARVEGRWAGFALTSDRVMKPHLQGRNMDEFFVLRCLRRQGVGREMAFQVFDTYRGYWQIAEIESNTAAQAFWRAVIQEYTAGRFEDFVREEHGQRLIWQTFDSREWR